MKRFKNYLMMLVWLLLIIMQAGCSKDDEPSTRDMLIGEWELDEINGQNISDFTMEITVDADGDYKEVITFDGATSTYRGEWKLIGQTIEIEYDDGDDFELTIEEITATKLVVEDEDNDEYEFEKN